MFTIVCCLVVQLGLGLDLVSGWLVVMHTYLFDFRLSRTGFNVTESVRTGAKYYFP